MVEILTNDVSEYLSNIDNVIKTRDFTTFHYIPSNYSKKHKEDSPLDLIVDSKKTQEKLRWKKFGLNDIVADKQIYTIGIDCYGADDDNTKFAESISVIFTPDIVDLLKNPDMRITPELSKEIFLEYMLQQNVVDKLVKKYGLTSLSGSNITEILTGDTGNGLGFNSGKLYSIGEINKIFAPMDEFFDVVHSKDYSKRLSILNTLLDQQFYNDNEL